MSQVLQHARDTRELLNPCLLKAGFLVVRIYIYCCQLIFAPECIKIENRIKLEACSLRLSVVEAVLIARIVMRDR